MEPWLPGRPRPFPTAGPESLILWFRSRKIGYIFLEVFQPFVSHLSSLRHLECTQNVLQFWEVCKIEFFPSNVRQIAAQRNIGYRKLQQSCPTSLLLEIALWVEWKGSTMKGFWFWPVALLSLEYRRENQWPSCLSHKSYTFSREKKEIIQTA